MDAFGAPTQIRVPLFLLARSMQRRGPVRVFFERLFPT
jgi:hypothetical protein